MDVKSLPCDRISSLPSAIIETILCLVPIKDAVRTSILSRDWRHKWVTIPKLEFDANNMFDTSNNDKHQSMQLPSNERKHFISDKYKFLYAVYRVLLQHQGPIVEFSLSMKARSKRVEIHHIIRHLSMKNILKKLTLDLRMDNEYRLPPSFFSLHHLTDLSLSNCWLDLDPPSNRFRLGSLTSLSLIDVNISTDTFEHLLSSNPSLKRLSVMLWDDEFEEATLDFEIEQFEFIRVIEHLSIWSSCLPDYELGNENVVPQKLPITLVHLKSLCILEMLFVYRYQIHGLFIIIRSSPNLEKLKLVQKILKNAADISNPGEINSLDDYSDIWLEHLKELEIENFTNLELEMKFVKLILAKSPVLKKVTIRLSDWIKNDEELKMLRILVRCRRASPSAEIIVERNILKDEKVLKDE